MARGYHKQPKLTAEKFVVDPFGAGRLYRTGDLARRLTNGEVEILGRLDQQFKLRGFRIEPGEIELVLTRQVGLAAAVVALRQDMPGGPQLVTYYVEHPGETESSAALRARLATILPDYMIPRAWVRLDRLPLLPSSSSTVRPCEAGSQVPFPSMAKTAWRRARRADNAGEDRSQVLGLERVGLRRPARSRYHSIHLFQIIARANKVGLRLTAKQLIQHRTIEKIARQLGDGESEHPTGGILYLKQFRQARHPHLATDSTTSSV